QEAWIRLGAVQEIVRTPFLDQKWEIIHAHSTSVRLSTLVCPIIHARRATATAAVTAAAAA
ncbi:MAG: hypothetical protein ACLTEP_09520, partial [Collinsella sp.]